jgi:hypothetical protein
MQYKTILGCAMYVDIKPPSLLSLSLQGCELDTVLGIKNILKSTAALKSLAKHDPLVEWPTVEILLGRIKDEGSEKTHQGAVLKNFSTATQAQSKQDAVKDLTALDEKMRERLKWSDTKLLRSLLVFLETQTWAKQSSAPVKLRSTRTAA